MKGSDERDLTVVDVLERFRGTVERLNTQLMNLTSSSSSDLVTQYLDLIESHIAKAEEFLLEEALAEFVSFSDTEVNITHVPNGIQFTPRAGGLRISDIPLWLAGNISPRKSPPNYHRARPWVRRVTWWYALIRHLKRQYLNTVWKHESLLTDVPPKYAHVTLKFRVTSKNIRDLDHYSVSPLINALVSNGLLLSDHAERLTYTSIWLPETGKDVLDVDVQYSNSKPLYLCNESSL